MQESLQNLFKLQHIDIQLFELERLKQDIPRQLEALDLQYAETEERLKQKREALEALQKDQRQHERDLSAAQEQLKKYQAQLHDVKTNKEYDALWTEIQGQKSVIAGHEESILQLLSEIEEMGKALEALQAEVETQRAEIEAKRKTLEQKLTTVDDEMRVKLDERNRVARQIQSRVISVYDRVRKGRPRPAVVPVKKGACSGCYHVIPLQKIAEIRRLDRIITCEGCGRILFVETGV